MTALLLPIVVVVGQAFLIASGLGWHFLPSLLLSSLSMTCVCGVARCCIDFPVRCIVLVGAVKVQALVRHTRVVVCFEDVNNQGVNVFTH